MSRLACSACFRPAGRCGGHCRSIGDLANEARRTLDTVGLLHLADHPVSEIAYGEKRRVELAMALAQKPRVLLLDEPLAGLSNAERADREVADRFDPAAKRP